ncbi:MAG: ribonuclease R [Acidiferrobacterales bacterium]
MSMRRRKLHRDRLREHDTRKHDVVIPSREDVLVLLERSNAPVSFEELTQELGVRGEQPLDAFTRRLRAMARDGQVLRNRRGHFGLIRKMDMVRGRVIGHPDGYGFLAPDTGDEDLFLPAKEMRQVLHGDQVVARITSIDRRGRKEGSIIEVLAHVNRTVVGRYFSENRVSVVVPEDKRISQDILIPRGDDSGAHQGQIVVAEIVDQPTRHTQPVGRVTELLGEHMAPGMEVEVAIRKYQIPHTWAEDTLTEAAELRPSVDSRAKRNREDLRSLPLVTIDGEDARDFDDAVYCEHNGKDWRLIVAIADVAYYVKPGRALDHEARARGNSVYFPERVVPMLPEVLSNGLCSLNPQVDRLCMVCEMQLGRRGKIKGFRFFEGVMRSHARLTYTEVAAILVNRDVELRRRYYDLLPHLQELYAVFKALHRVRIQRGAVDFELPETRFIFDEHHKIQRIVPIERNDAHRLIEECMLAANVCAAEFLKEHKVPAPYRVHEGPTSEKLSDLREFLIELGLSLGGGANPQPQDYAELLAAINARPDSRLIQMALLLSLSQALYSPDNIGHFALGYENYTHFTSPIRRYPDLLVHRAMKDILRNRPVTMSQAEARTVGEHCSMTERRADEATRDVTRWLKAEYMMDRVGDEFDGMVTGVKNFGIFVELTDVYVDGLVHITALENDYFHFDPLKHRLTGSRTRKTYRLGDRLRVRVVRVDLDEARIDLEPVSGPGRRVRRGRGQRKRKMQKSRI